MKPEVPEVTFGDNRVNVIYKDDEAENIETIRNVCAGLIDFLKEHENARTTGSPEIGRLYSLAYTEIENACMWSIKAITK